MASHNPNDGLLPIWELSDRERLRIAYEAITDTMENVIDLMPEGGTDRIALAQAIDRLHALTSASR